MSVTAKSVILDIADGFGNTTWMGLRSVDFYLSGVLIPLTPTDFAAYDTTHYATGALAEYTFDTTLSKVGTSNYTGWEAVAYAVTNQRLIVVFDSLTTFDKIIVNNFTSYGGSSDRGVKNVVITASTDAITDTTYNAAITNSTVLFTGVFNEHVAVNVEDPQTVWEDVASVSVLTATLNQIFDLQDGILQTVLQQSYDLTIAELISSLSQNYDIRQFLTVVLTQEFSDNLIAVLTQKYGNKELITSVLKQYYGSSSVLLATLFQEYHDKYVLNSTLDQRYSLRGLIQKVLAQKYSLPNVLDPKILTQKYDMDNLSHLLAKLTQTYSMFPSATSGDNDFWVTINGKRVHTLSIDYSYGLDSYCGSFQLTLAKYTEWLDVDYLQHVVIHVNTIDHHSIVIDMGDNLSNANSTYTVECRSSSVLLDFPYAAKIPEEFVVAGLAADVVGSLAALEGFSVSWELTCNPPLTNATSLVGSSPLGGIKSIVNPLGGKVQTYPDGSIHIVKRYKIDTDKYGTVTPAILLTTGLDFTVLNTNTEKQDGYNRYFVSDSTTTDGYNLVTEQVTSTKYKVKAFKVPWSSQPVLLTTSEYTNITITPSGPVINYTEETLEEEIEIVEGAGRVSLPCYNLQSYDYTNSRVNLGNVTVKESGDVTTNMSGNTIVKIKYTTRYWMWYVVDTDVEKVQVILVKV